MRRRGPTVSGSAAAVALPAIVRAEASRVIKFVPDADVAVFDPVVSPSWQTRDHAYLVYDTFPEFSAPPWFLAAAADSASVPLLHLFSTILP